MKEIKKRRYSIFTKFKCEVCGKVYYSAEDAINCEKSHTCEHEAFYKFDDASSDSWWFNIRGISSTCKKCNMDLGSVDFEDIEDSQEILETIYQLVNEYNNHCS